MNDENGRGFCNNTYSNNNAFSNQFSSNPNIPYIQNSVPFHSMPVHNQYYQRPQPPISVPYRMPFSAPQEPVHQNYYHSLPLYNDKPNNVMHPNNSTISTSKMPFSNSIAEENRFQANSHLSCPSIPSTDLKPSAEAFVPKSVGSDQNLARCDTESSNSNISTGHSKVFVNNSLQNNSTRPKEYFERKGWPNKRNFAKTSNWQNKENNKAYGNFSAEKNNHGAYTDRPANNYDYSESTNSKTNFPTKSNMRNKNDQKTFVDPRNSKPNQYQNRQNYYQKRPDFRKSNNGTYENYNYHEEERGNNYHSNNYSKRGSKRFPYPNGNTRDNNFGQLTPKEMQDIRYNRGYANNYNQNAGNQYKNDQPNNLIFEAKKSSENEDYYREKETKSNENAKVVEKIKIISNGDEKLQRENMIENLTKGMYECMVCCDRIKQSHAIWSCNKCYNCFHLGCIKKWAGASQGDPGWRCPACQNQNTKLPNGYFCFCKKLREPEWNRREMPHSCGEVCGKGREYEWCSHKCTILCHPGPCPDCSAFIERRCQCGKNSKQVRCSQTESYLCEEVCGKVLNCGVHKCEKLCHNEACDPCGVILDKECFCGKETKKEECNAENSSALRFACSALCNKLLSCGFHNCDQLCHEGDCNTCRRAIETVINCPCGKMNLKEYYKTKEKPERKSCLDPIPTCGKICGKVLKCGTPGDFHSCKFPCHEGPCPPCERKTAVKCRCGFMDKNIPCSELLTKADEVTCEKQCKKLRQCGRHKCGMKCCIDIDHICDRICGRPLKCRQHKCQEPCHRGNCPRCWETSFEELSCHCGASVLYPPIHCGTEPPACDLPCQRKQSCAHEVAHTCHSDPKCPPCTTLVKKPCFGNHTIMKSTPCYLSAISCGEQCAKRLPCGVHLCQKVCHEGSCIKGSSCTQKCIEQRTTCEHPCGNPCHKGPCPNTPCKEMVTVTCICGIRKLEMVCSENEKEYKSMATSKLASELHSLNSGGSVNISQIFSRSNKTEKLKRLECNDDCGLVARNRQLALALQITNPDAREFLNEGSNLYTDSIKAEARKDIQFAQVVHDALNDLVLKAKQSKQKSRSHSFAPMNSDKRRFIHEYAKYFSCQSQSYDEEPKKNVVVTAFRNMSRLPPISVVAVIQKEQGQRKGPGPVLNRKTLANEENGTQLKRLEKASSFEKKESPPKEPNVIDYFDFS